MPTELLFRMLDGVIPELNSKAVPVDTMTGYYIEKALEALDGRATRRMSRSPRVSIVFCHFWSLVNGLCASTT